MPTLSKIIVYPIKSLGGVSIGASAVLSSGALAWDRRFAIVDKLGQLITGKRTPEVHAIRAEFNLERQTVDLRDTRCDPTANAGASFSLVDDTQPIDEWLSDAFDQNCRLIENTSQGFPDDPEALGPTLLSTASLQAIASWFGNLSLEETRRRFRANMEIDAPEPFWEDRLVGESRLRPARFRIGAVEFLGRKPCARCAVPTRSSETGEVIPRFAQSFARHREESLPDFAPRDRFDHFYRLAVNTSLANMAESSQVAVGDLLEVIAP